MLLSIIIPVYQVEDYVFKTLSSIYSSAVDEKLYEVIVVNDGTKDKSMSIVEPFADTHYNMLVINQKNQGLSAARNNGLNAAKGDYVWFVDSDDWIETENLKSIIDNLKHSDVDVFLYKMKHFNENGEQIDGWSNFTKQVTLTGQDLILQHYPYTPMQEFIINREFLVNNQLLFKIGIFHEDQEFAPRMLMSCSKVSVSPIVSYCYLRRNGGSIMTDNSKLVIRKKHIIEIFDEYYTQLNTTKDSKLKRVLNVILYDVISGFYGGLSMENLAYLDSNLNLSKYKDSFKKIVRNNMNLSRGIKLVVRQLLFCLSPNLLCRLGLNL